MQTPNGILPIDKPAGWTSFDVLAKLRGALGTRKLGHSGTLDPMATGVLAVFIGKATAAADRQLDHDKTYEATLRLGLRTDTGDVTGTTLETAPVTVGEAELRAVLPQFRGDRMQLPPMYSAVKINGQPLYKAARKGQTVERTPRPITIYEITYLGSPAPGDYTIRVSCSKGTYIRTLLEDIADALGQKGTMSALRRTCAGLYTEADAQTEDDPKTNLFYSGKVAAIEGNIASYTDYASAVNALGGELGVYVYNENMRNGKSFVAGPLTAWNFLCVPQQSTKKDQAMQFLNWLFENRDNHDLFELSLIHISEPTRPY